MVKHPEPLPQALTSLDRCLVMGVVNVTPDSFSDGGSWYTTTQAIARGKELLRQGADIIDVGGESTRPGAARVDSDEELRRVLPVIEALVDEAACISVDTTRATVAVRALELGATIINDVSGGLADPEMYAAVAESEAVYVAMHWRGPSDIMTSLAGYTDVVTDVRDELSQRVEALLAAGVRRQQIVLDPGLGFSKTGQDNWPLLTHIETLRALGFPVLIGASRKRFLGRLLAGADGVPLPPLDRDAASAAISALSAVSGAWCVRVHEVASSLDAVRVAAKWREAASKEKE